jgi:hypothetical protein
MIETIETGSPKLLGLKLSGKLHDEDYKQFVPGWEIITTAEGKLRLFLQFEDFHGWNMDATWDDFKLSPKHDSDFERIAIVGDRKWEKLMTRFAKPFIPATIEYFDRSEIAAAWAWLRESEDEKQDTEEHQTLAMPTEASRSNPWIWYGL